MSDAEKVPEIKLLPQEEAAETDPTGSFPEVVVPTEGSDTGGLLDAALENRTKPDRKVWYINEGNRGVAGPGRTPMDVDERLVKAMAMVGGSNQEIAEFVGMKVDTFRHRFRDILREARAGRKLRLRQAQYNLAMAGNAAMQIWLGKQELGQFDESRVRVGSLERYSDEELAQLAAGKVPGQLGPGKTDDVDKPEKE